MFDFFPLFLPLIAALFLARRLIIFTCSTFLHHCCALYSIDNTFSALSLNTKLGRLQGIGYRSGSANSFERQVLFKSRCEGQIDARESPRKEQSAQVHAALKTPSAAAAASGRARVYRRRKRRGSRKREGRRRCILTRDYATHARRHARIHALARSLAEVRKDLCLTAPRQSLRMYLPTDRENEKFDKSLCAPPQSILSA